MKIWELRFTVVPGVPFCVPGKVEAAYEGSQLTVQLWYDSHDVPLQLCAACQAGDSARLVLMPWRIELYIGDKLMDEEWPWGNLLLQPEQVADRAEVQQIQTVRQEVPSVLRTFCGAEGWQPEQNVYVGDCMPYTSGGRYHVLYLKDRRRHASKWGKGAHQWAHISTQDFVTWQEHPMAVEIDDPNEGSICTGSHMEKDGLHLLFYTVRTCDGSPAPIRRSVSEDGYHFAKDTRFSFTLSERYTGASARDPKVVQAADGLYHMFVTTSLAKEGIGCLAHLVSCDLDTWTELPEPIYIAPEGSGEPECPDYAVYAGRYYLIFSLHGVGQYRVSEQPFAGFREPCDPVIPCKSVPKCAQWEEKLVFAGFDGGGKYAGTLTFRTAQAGEDGELIF